MTDKTDRSDPTHSSPGPGQKRPHATLDLRAVELKTAASNAEGKSDATGTSATASAASSASAPPDAKPDRKLPPPAPRRGFGVISHMLAGLAGGLIVLLGGDKLAPALNRLGVTLPASEASATAIELKQRLDATEAAAKSAAPADKLAEAESRLAKLEQTTATQATLEDTQAKLAALGAEVAEKSALEDASARIKKLEDQLSTMAAAASNDKDGGTRIQGLAAVTGKLSELETALSTKLAELKRGLIVEMEPKLAAATDASEQARTGTERLDREILALRSDTARLEQKTDVQKSDSERLSATVQVVQDSSAQLASGLNGLKTAVDKQLSEADVASAVTPVTEKIAALEESVEQVVKSEAERKTGAERVVASLELGNLKRRLERGEPFGAELTAVKSVLNGKIDLSPLDRFKDSGIVSEAALLTSFAPVANRIIDAGQEPVDGSVFERLAASAKSVVRVRKISHDPDDQSAEAIAARIESALKAGKPADALTLAKSLPDAPRAAAADWIAQLEARQSVEAAVLAVEADLKTALRGGVGAPPSAEKSE